MKFKNLFDFKNISRFLALALVIFLSLPLIFPDKEKFRIIKKESIYSHKDSPLPVFPKENLLDKYVHKLKKFYKMDVPVFASQEESVLQQQQQIQENDETEVAVATKAAKENIDITSRDLFFTGDYDDEADIYSATEREDNTVNLQKGTVLTRDGLTLEPTQEGYYYEGKFYKNGTYPKNANRKYIEGALSRYHSSVAKNLGKKALYFADENGNLTVSYENNLPSEFSTDIDTYLAQNRNRTVKQTLNSHKTYKHTDKYNNTKSNFSNIDISASDVALASLKDMHAAYNLLNHKIQSGEIGQGILPDSSNLIPMGNIILNQTAIAQPPVENPEGDEHCQGESCSDSYRIAPIMFHNKDGVPSSDLELFYSALCNEEGKAQEEGENEPQCQYSEVYHSDQEKPFNLDIENEEQFNQFKDELSNSDKKILEIAYINPNKEYVNIMSSLQDKALTNKNGEVVEVRLRGIDKVPENASFGDKMVGPYKSNINKDLVSPNGNVSYETLVNKYNEVDKEHKEGIDQIKNREFYKEFFPDMNVDLPVAFVEQSEDKKYFIINNTDIPKGYIQEISQWEKYQQEDGSYIVPKDVVFNAPSDVVIIAVQEGAKKDLTLQNGHPIGLISKDVLKNVNFDNVKSTKFEISNVQIETILYNAGLGE